MIRSTSLPSLTIFPTGVAVSGSSGFIGSHLVAALEAGGEAVHYDTDILDPQALASVAKRHQVHTLVHLAAAGTVLTDLRAIPRMVDVSLDGVLNLIDAFGARTVIYSSTCAVYGDTPESGAAPVRRGLQPVSAYGISKVLTERALEQWASRAGTAAVSLRLGNVIGPGCRGLIAYLMSHVRQFPDGSVPAHMRGAGRIVRDYVPVQTVVSIILAALAREWKPGEMSIFNAGSGTSMSNGRVAEILVDWLTENGYCLKVTYAPDPELGEAAYSRLIMDATWQTFSLRPPTPNEVQESILDGARSLLDPRTEGAPALKLAR